ncbi:hypothetical protein [Streptacidiphilus cavernicola]|uniref:Uncharacterized protein n=1 Tax=Streptacidiphilus cavernicola TaxID=3342716 RepID=A0ABV6VQW0_9ACTN
MTETMPTSQDRPGDPAGALRDLAAVHRARLAQRHSASEERRRKRELTRHRNRRAEAVRRAAAFTGRQLPRTLDRVLDGRDWTGYTHPGAATLTAVAPLGQDLWALFRHETAREDITSTGMQERLWLVVPTGPGGYTELPCRDDDELATALGAWDGRRADRR